MAKAKEAQQWAKEEFKGIIETLYTPWTKDDEIDEAALRQETRRVLVDFKSEGLWYCGNVGEGALMTMAEMKKVAEIVIDEARQVKPKAILVACSSVNSAKDCVELINHSAQLGADLAVIQTPRFVYGEEGILSWYGYVAEHTDIALSFFQQTPWTISPQLMAKMAERWPAFCATKELGEDFYQSAAITELSKGKIQVYNIHLAAHLSGMVQRGELAPVLHGMSSYRLQLPPELKFRDFWETLVRGDLREAVRKYYDYRFFHLNEFMQRFSRGGHGFPGVKMHSATLEKYWAALLGMPMGTGGWQKYRAGETTVPQWLQDKCRSLLIEAGLLKA